MSLMASMVTTSRMQQCSNVLIDIYHEFLLLFYCCVLLEIKLTTTTIDGSMRVRLHYSDVIMSAMVTQITGVSIVCSIVGSGAYQGKHQRSTSLAFVRGIHRWLVNSPHKGPVTRKMFPFDDVMMKLLVRDTQRGNCIHCSYISSSMPSIIASYLMTWLLSSMNDICA